ncbi:sigma-70 family RNA polymerase sigma factor [Pontibacillus yanchengensis]|uniref:RNA polymerase n=1 Tax=Pontibacillus yanchengensis Y32 TaxID=1385514 RepID=A0A0A2TK47_9BACI|nr:sigma-70 family RNA polymerase sigma factor [Pontibacillus yanchengensis]KGP74456.1 RNA polymerase [Pontibacillus yanchengensis Y32]
MKIIRLVKKAQKGDRKAYSKLFQHYEDAVYRTAYIYMKDQDDALDVLQETAYRSFTKIHTLKDPTYFKTWLIRIAINASFDMLRKRQNVVQLHPEMEEGITDHDEVDIPLSISLQQLLHALEDMEKSVILLRFYHDYTIRETAEILDIPIGTGKTILYRALKKLRRMAEEADVREQ